MNKEQKWEALKNAIHKKADQHQGVMLMAEEAEMLSDVLRSMQADSESRITRLAFIERQLQQVRLKVRHLTQELDY